ncbi:protein tyrosine phosphatase family protein [Fischerella thermalis]|uniref:protein tyrosine phosphatase family protein n=1 Tax=Fischerella thermalis TaxID=372787 RepID=UPI0019F3811E|nr:protein tyrosine phosphatase family protein [Fischerella thermalis]MBF1990966.1 protein tyrosine phosphatase family protein [Fischerella thermalis M58_A2018_009]MBF2062589.1 protein tyrosine phosphatase family protein [Fischerella thermalis M66_A2018_004]
MENVKKINDELTVAGQVTLEQLQQAVSEGYKSVLNLRSPDEQGFISDEQQQAQALGLHYINIPVKPNEISDELTTEVLKQIDDLPKPALIHCASAMRAGVMAFMNVATRQGMTPEQVFEKAAEAGFDFNANPQMKQFLEHYVSTHSQTN